MPKTKYPIFKCLHNGEKGFTLIELLIVVAILGIIAAVVIPNISGFMITGELSAANSEAENVKTASLGYFGEYGYWPTDSSVLVPDYITGTMKAVYDISDDYGWLISASNQTWTDGITFAPGTDASDGNHGEWVRDSS
jgi:prepilin-type N-terminal cleavage/methylation domain-containing protein